jgi:hypothetical protein
MPDRLLVHSSFEVALARLSALAFLTVFYSALAADREKPELCLSCDHQGRNEVEERTLK